MQLKTIKRSFFLFLSFLFIMAATFADDLRAMPPVNKTVLSNHLIILYSEDHSLPFITLKLLIDGGSRRDPSGEEGLASLTSDGLLLGTSVHSLAQINEELDFMGASLNSSAGRDFSTMDLRVLSKDLDKALDLFMEVLTQPAFPDGEIEREKQKTLAALQAEEDQPDDVAEKAFHKALFLSSPYAHPVNGTKESIPNITREKIVSFYKTWYHPNNFVISVVGDISPEEVKQKISARFEKMPLADIPDMPFNAAFAKGPETIRINRDITQANIIIGNEGISRENPDYYAVSVMNYILGGGGFASRLLEEIRNKRGLAYSVASFFDAQKYPGSFQIVLQTKNKSAHEAIDIAIRQMGLIRQEPVSDKELEGAQKYLIGSFPMRIDTQEKLSAFLLLAQYYGLGMDYPEKYPSLIRSVTKEDVLRVAKKYLHPENLLFVVVGNLEEAGMNKDMQIREAR
jgi:zinc protease